MIKQYCFACIILLSLIACNRNGMGGKMSVSVPVANLMHQRNSAMATTPPLQTVIVNVRPTSGGTPLIIHQDYNSTVVNDLTFQFDNVPTGDLLVQVLAVYANNGGAVQISYGDTNISFPTVTTAEVTLGSTNITKQTYLAGRVKYTDGSFPNGTLIALFTPGTGKPQMEVDSTSIVAGWFNIFAVDGTGSAFDYVLKETGTTIFSGLNSSLSTDAAGATCVATSLSGGCPISYSGSDRLKVSKPASYSRNGDYSNPMVQVNSPTDYVLGFFGILAGGTRNVCYAADVYEALPRLFSDVNLSTPLEVRLVGGSTSQVRVQGSGGNSNFGSSSLYTNGATGYCDNTQLNSGHALILNHTLLGESDENFGGFNSPWMMIQPFNTSGNQYVSVVTPPTYATTATFTSGASTATLNAAFTPLAGSSISGSGISGTLTSVTATASPGVWTVGLSTPTSSSGTAATVTLQQPYAQLEWSLLPGVAFSYSSISLTAGTSTVSIPTISEPIVRGLYVRDLTNPSAIPASTMVTNVTGTSPYVVTMNQAPAAAGSDVLSFSYLSGVEVWARPIFNGQAITNGSTDVVISPAMATSALVGQPISGDTIPSGAKVVSVVDSSHITISAVTNGSTTTGYVMIGNSSYGGGKNDCTTLSSQGFVFQANVDPAIGKYSFSGLNGLPVGSNVSYQFALCAVVGTGTTKSYLGSYVTGQPSWWGGDNRWPFGWASSTKANSTAVDAQNDLQIASVRLNAVSFPNPGLTQLTTATNLTISPNDEVLISIAAHGSGAADCGGAGGGTGVYAYARVLSVSGSSLVIPSGSWVDQLALSPSTLTATAAVGGNFCYVQVTRVAQYRTLTLASGLTNSSNTPVAMLLGSESIIPIKVNGTMTINGSIDLSGTGYLGGYYSAGPNGAGDGGPYSSVSGSRKGGQRSSSGGGGAGCSNGGAGSASGSGGSAYCYSNTDSLMLSLGGGGGAGTSVNGGNGGGALILAAYNLSVGSNVTISENGASASTIAGGGGGGSINLIAGSVSGSSTLVLSAEGGDGGSTGGGPGGGGYVSALACSSNIPINPEVTAGQAGTGAFIGVDGLSTINYSSNLSSKRWCY